MGLIDFILSLVGLLLWLHWRAVQSERRLRPPAPAALAGTLKLAEPGRWRGWVALGSLGLLLGLRSIFYWQLSASTDWTPHLNLAIVVLSFRADHFLPCLIYSMLAFIRLWVVFYFWLLTLAVLNREVLEPGPVLRLIRLHLGGVVRWPWHVQWLVLPVGLVTGLWVALHPLLVWIGTALPAPSWATRLEQGLLVSLGLYLSLKFILPILLLIHLVTTYIFLGRNPLWEFVTQTSNRLLKPLRRCRFARIDFAPVLGVAVVGLLLHWLPLLVWAVLSHYHLALWPQ